MSSPHERNTRSKWKRQKSYFSQQSKQQEAEDKDYSLESDEKIDRSCQKYLFQSKQDDIGQGHQGDQEVLDMSQNSQNESIVNIKDEINIQSQQIQTEFYNQTEQFPVGSPLSKKVLFSKLDTSSQNNQNYDSQIKNYGDTSVQEISFPLATLGYSQCAYIKTENSQIQKDQSDISLSKKMMGNKRGTNFKGKQNCSRIHEKQDSWIQDDMIFEKNMKQLNRKMTIAVMKIQKNVTLNMDKHQQNFQKATNIINRLLNNSMNRIMRIRQHVQNFVALLKFRMANKRIDNLCMKDYAAINDLCFFYKQHQKKKQNSFLQKHLNLVLKLTQSIPIFMPTDTIRVIWDVFQVIYTYIFLYFYSILMFFNQDNPDSDFIETFFFYSFFFFLVDILINFNTAYFDKDTIIQKRRLIAKQYIFSTLFITDCTSLMVQASKVIYRSSSIVYNPNHNLLVYGFNMLIFLKMNGMSPKQKRFYYVFTLKDSQKHIIKLINQLVSVITVAHIAAIGWYFIGVQEIVNEQETNWLNKLGISSQLYYEKYIYSIYWSITTMTTDYKNSKLNFKLKVGYGDIAATNYIEALFIAINMILFSCVFAYSINNIGFILQEIEKSSKLLNDNITTIQRYLNRKNVNISLKSRVRHYLSFLAQEQKDRDKESEDQIISILSNKLRDEITVEINSRILNNYHIFSSNFSQATLKKLIFRMKEVLVSPNEVIFSDEEYDDLSIYFIQNGVIEIYQQSVVKQGQATVIQTLQENQLFGELSFFSGLSRKASARSVNLSTLYKISREDFLDILNECDEDYQRFKMMQEQIIFQNELSVLYIECYSCKQMGHLAKSCPRTHQQFDKQFTILRNNISFFQEREDKERSLSRKKEKSCQLVKKNEEMSNLLKENLENLNTEVYFMFNSEENINGSEFTSSDQDQEQEDDEESQSQSQNAADNKSQVSQVSHKKNSFLIKKANKNQKKESMQITLNNNNTNETDQNQTLEILQIKQQSSNHVADSQDFRKSTLNLASQNKLKSQEINDASESSNKISQSNKTIGAENSQIQRKDSESLNSNVTELQQKQIQEEIEQINEVQRNQQRQKSYLGQKKPQSNNFSYSYNINKASKKTFEDPEIQNSEHFSSERFSQTMTNQIQSSLNSKRMNTQNSQKTINYDNNDVRCSIDQIILQGVIANTILQAQRQSQISLKTPSIHSNILQDIYDKNQKKPKSEHDNESSMNKKQNSVKSILEHKEEKSFKNLQNINCIQGNNSANNTNNNPNTNNQNSNTILGSNQQSNANGKNQSNSLNQQMDDMQFVDRFSRLIQSSNLPLLLQYTSGLSFKEMQSLAKTDNMEFFDKMFNFKKFFPHNNFDKVINKLKFIQSEQKRIKKKKLTQKQRRLNVLLPANLTRTSIFNIKSGQIKIALQDFNIDTYRPTYLSYGVGMRNANIFPKNKYNQE